MTSECPNSSAGSCNVPFRGHTYALPAAQDVERTTRQRIGVGSMAKFCQGEAAARFKQRPQQILTLA